MTLLNKGFSPITDNEKQAENLVKNEIKNLNTATTESFGVQRTLAVAVCDWAFHIGSKENNLNQVPDGKVLRSAINKLIEGMYGNNDADIVTRLKSSASDAVKLAQLAIGENTGFKVGYRLAGRTKDTFREISEWVKMAN